MSTTPVNIRYPGCGHQQAPTERCHRCGWNLSLKLWQLWLKSKGRICRKQHR